MTNIRAYVILDVDGNLKAKRGIYLQYKRACLWANSEGDSVVEIEIPRDRAPQFIRRKTV